MVFKISIAYTNLDTMQMQAVLVEEYALSLPLMPIWLDTQQNIMYLLATFKKTHFRITILIKGCSIFIYCKVWRHNHESVKIYLDAIESFPPVF